MDIATVNVGKSPVSLNVQVEGVNGYYDIYVFGSNGKWYYHRRWNEPEVTINLPTHTEQVYVSVNKGKIKNVDIGLIQTLQVPYPDQPIRRRPYSLKDLRFYERPGITGPARISKHVPVVELNPDLMMNYPEHVQKFIQLHEAGHTFFDEEDKTDAWAAVTFVNNGYNLSTALFALTRVLNRDNPANLKRVFRQHELLKEIDRYYGR